MYALLIGYARVPRNRTSPPNEMGWPLSASALSAPTSTKG